MSIKSLTTPDRRRKPDAVRKEALAIGRRLLIEGGPAAITLKAIGAEMGMSHANLIHHFGSAEAFQTQLKNMMVEELTRTVTALVRHDQDGSSTAEIVDTVFSAYGPGGLGRLVAWSATTGPAGEAPGLDEALRELVAVLEPLVGGPDTAAHARARVLLVSILALGDSLIGQSLARCLGSDPQEMRQLTVWILGQLHNAGR